MKSETADTGKPAAAGKAPRAKGKSSETQSAPPKKTKTAQEMPDTQQAWRGFKPGLWQRDVNIRWFIQQHYTPYEGDGKFLAPATDRTKRIWKKLEEMFVEERKKGVLEVS